MRFQPESRPSKWGATAAVARGARLEAAIDLLSLPGSHPFDGLVRLSDVTEVKGYRYLLTQVSLDFAHPAFGGVADLLDELGGAEFQLIVVESPEGDLYLIVDKENLPEEEARPDHPLLQRLAKWLGRALAR
jgi:phosphoglycolate phosphatase-like HAD superfamily hydrolase